MKLSLWNAFLDRINQKSDANVKTVIVVNAKDKRDIVHLLKKFKYYHPVYIDADGSMNKINKFPSDPIFQSFLLDKSHRVIAVGNPVYLYSVDSLYQSILNGEKSLSHNVNSIMVVKNGTIDLGNIKSGQIISEKFYLSNSGNDTVNILYAISSCECVSVELSDSLILPNATIFGMMEFESDSTKGVFSRNIHIFYKGFDYPSIINIIGKIN